MQKVAAEVKQPVPTQIQPNKKMSIGWRKLRNTIEQVIKPQAVPQGDSQVPPPAIIPAPKKNRTPFLARMKE
jgi:hypothetical protein